MVQSDAYSFCSNALAAAGRQDPAAELLRSLLLTASYLLLSSMGRKARQLVVLHSQSEKRVY